MYTKRQWKVEVEVMEAFYSTSFKLSESPFLLLYKSHRRRSGAGSPPSDFFPK